MKTTALRLYGKNDLRLETFDLPPLAEDEILASVVTNSICMSCHKATLQGEEHKRVPQDLAQHPIIIGHEFAGTILEVGKKWAHRFRPGQKYSIQPALNYPGREMEAPGYSFRWLGGNATRVLIPREVLEQDCLLPYEGEGFFKASLAEPVSCVIGAVHTQYHFRPGTYLHENGIRKGGCMAILGGAGPMGLEMMDYILHGPAHPRLLVVTDIDPSRLARAAQIFSPSAAAQEGVLLHYAQADQTTTESLRALTDGKGFDDVFVFAPIPAVIEQASQLLGFNGCLNFFAGPAHRAFWAAIDFYEVHYSGHHVVGSSGGNTDDMREALCLMASGRLNPAVMVTHIGGLDAAADTILHLPSLPGAKKLIYTGISMPLTALSDFVRLGKTDAFFRELAHLVEQNNGLWSVQAEHYLLRHGRSITASVSPR